jgi:hypothetical protein
MKYEPWFDSEENKMLMAICTRRWIRNIGIGGIVWGLLNIGIGVVAMQDTLINAGILILGILMLGAGFLALRRPTLGVLLVETIITILLLIWNIGVLILNMLAGEASQPHGVIFTVFIAYLFISNYRKLGHLRELVATIEPGKIKATKQMCKAIVKQKLKGAAHLVQTTDRKCRAQLIEDRAFFIHRDMMRAFVAGKDAVEAAIVKPAAPGWTLRFVHPLGELRYRFDKASTAKLREWLARDTPLQSLDADA